MRVLPHAVARICHPFYEQQKNTHPDCEAARAGWHPYIHQAVLFDEWNRHDAFLLTTKTGSGKTQAAALPVIANRESAFFVYPTNALIEDQQRSILNLAEGLGWTPYVYQTGEEFDRMAFNRADVLLVRVDAENLEHLRHLSRFRTKGQTLLDILNLGGPTIVLTNPDTLFLILALRYGEGMSIFSSLSQYSSLVVDEFHLYGGVELAHLLFMLHYCRANAFFGGRVLLLSATPDEKLDKLLDAVFAPYRVSGENDVLHPFMDERTVAHPVDLVPLSTGGDPVETALIQFEKLRPDLERLFAEISADDYAPLVMIFNSVMAAMYAADLLRERFNLHSDQIGEYRGLMDRSLRSFKNKLVIVGTSAIEVGVDFKCRYLIFEAGDAASFMQRFGRIGRHEDGTAYLLAPPNVLNDAQSVSMRLTRDELESKVRIWYAQNDARPWFLQTESGMLTVALLAQRLVDEVAADHSAAPDVVQQAQEKVDGILDDYVSRIGASHAYKQVRKMLELYQRNTGALPWIQSYSMRMAFRTASINFRVHDVREEQRRLMEILLGGWYEADLRILLSRAKNFTLKLDKHGQEYVTIYGYTKAGHVEANVQVGELGQFYTTHQMREEHNERVLLIRDGKTSRLSDKVMDQDHIFVVVPNSIGNYVDWRIATFHHPQGLMAFDGDALLLKEIYERYKIDH